MSTRTEQQRAAVVVEAMTWVRTPYHHSARVKGAGVDCVQILIAVYSAVGLIGEVSTGEYVSDWMLHRDEEKYLNNLLQYAHPVDTPKPGDIAMFKYGRTISHGSIIIEWPMIIHAFRNEHMVTISDASKGDLEHRLHGFYSPWGDK